MLLLYWQVWEIINPRILSKLEPDNKKNLESVVSLPLFIVLGILGFGSPVFFSAVSEISLEDVGVGTKTLDEEMVQQLRQNNLGPAEMLLPLTSVEKREAYASTISEKNSPELEISGGGSIFDQQVFTEYFGGIDKFNRDRKRYDAFMVYNRANHGLWPDSRIRTTRMDLNFAFDEKNRKRYDLILLGYSLNELLDEEGDDSNYRQLLFCLPSLLNKKGLVIITEPAQAEICHALHQNCAKLTKEDPIVSLHAPYFNGMTCPLAEKQSKYFSHEVRKMNPPLIMDKINRPLNLEVSEIKFALSILGTNKPMDLGHGQQVCRIISPVKKRKGTVSFIGMAGNGEEYTYEFQRRNLQKEELKDLLCLNRGDILKLSDILVNPDRSNRIRLQKMEQISPLFMPRFEG